VDCTGWRDPVVVRVKVEGIEGSILLEGSCISLG
jgi:hypothetical protein